MHRLVDEVWEKIKLDGHTPLYAVKIGAHMFGTQTDSSDHDYRIVYAPDIHYLTNAKRITLPNYSISTSVHSVKNSSHDVDVSVMTIQTLIRGFEDGEVNAMDTMFAPAGGRGTLIAHQGFAEGFLPFIRAEGRPSIRSFERVVKYSINQINKYGVRGTRLYEAKQLLSYLESLDRDLRIDEIANSIPKGEHIEIRMMKTPKGELPGIRLLGKSIHPRDKVGAAIEKVKSWIGAYGSRSQKLDASGIDWKAFSHAVRALYQAIEYANTGWINFPRPEAKHLKEIKLGVVPIDIVVDEINELLSEVRKIRLEDKGAFDIFDEVYAPFLL